MKVVKYVALGAAAIAAIDLMFGNTGKSPLPDAVTNQLSQQTDFVLLAGGIATFFLVK